MDLMSFSSTNTEQWNIYIYIQNILLLQLFHVAMALKEALENSFSEEFMAFKKSSLTVVVEPEPFSAHQSFTCVTSRFIHRALAATEQLLNIYTKKALETQNRFLSGRFQNSYFN